MGEDAGLGQYMYDVVSSWSSRACFSAGKPYSRVFAACHSYALATGVAAMGPMQRPRLSQRAGCMQIEGVAETSLLEIPSIAEKRLVWLMSLHV